MMSRVRMMMKGERDQRIQEVSIVLMIHVMLNKEHIYILIHTNIHTNTHAYTYSTRYVHKLTYVRTHSNKHAGFIRLTRS